MIFSLLYIWQIREELEAEDARGVREPRVEAGARQLRARHPHGRWQAERGGKRGADLVRGGVG